MDLLQPLNLPPYPFKLTDHDGQLTIFDEIRKKELVLTPEEWVRQHFVQYLINDKGYPKGLIKLEGGLRVNHMPRRSDIVVHGREGQKLLMVECKAPSVPLSQKVFDQIARYNMTAQVAMLAVSNGLQHVYCRINLAQKNYQFIEELPAYSQLAL